MLNKQVVEEERGEVSFQNLGPERQTAWLCSVRTGLEGRVTWVTETGVGQTDTQSRGPWGRGLWRPRFEGTGSHDRWVGALEKGERLGSRPTGKRGVSLFCETQVVNTKNTENASR